MVLIEERHVEKLIHGAEKAAGQRLCAMVLMRGVDVVLVGGVGGWCWWVVLVSLITQCVINNGS